MVPLAATSLRLGDETVPAPGSVPEASLGRQPLGKACCGGCCGWTLEGSAVGGFARSEGPWWLAVKAKLVVLEALTRGLASRRRVGTAGRVKQLGSGASGALRRMRCAPERHCLGAVSRSLSLQPICPRCLLDLVWVKLASPAPDSRSHP